MYICLYKQKVEKITDSLLLNKFLMSFSNKSRQANSKINFAGVSIPVLTIFVN